MKIKPYKNEIWLKHVYLIEKWSVEEIAKQCNVSAETIYVHLNKYGITKGTRNAK